MATAGSVGKPAPQGNRLLTRTTQATQTTVVPAKAGIQEIPGERTCQLLRILDSGFRRNDGSVAGGSTTEGYVSRPAPE